MCYSRTPAASAVGCRSTKAELKRAYQTIKYHSWLKLTSLFLKFPENEVAEAETNTVLRVRNKNTSKAISVLHCLSQYTCHVLIL